MSRSRHIHRTRGFTLPAGAVAALCIAVLVAPASSGEEMEPAAPEDIDWTSPPSFGFAPYACASPAEVYGPRVDVTAAGAEAIETMRALLHTDVSDAWQAEAERALEMAAWVTPDALTYRERVELQNLTFRVMRKLVSLVSKTGSPVAAHLQAEGYEVISALALPAEELEVLGSEPESALEAWLGPRANWIERSTNRCGDGVLHHEKAYKGALAFHPLRAGDTRALVAQRIAWDTEGRAHVTPFIEKVELRHGFELTSSACIVAPPPAAATDVALRAVLYADIHEDKFVRKKPGATLGCNGCHRSATSFSAEDVRDPAEAAALTLSRHSNIESWATSRLSELEPISRSRL